MEQAWQALHGHFDLHGPFMRWALFIACTAVLFLVILLVFGTIRKQFVARATRSGRASDAYLARVLEHTGMLTLLAVSALIVLGFDRLDPPAWVGRGSAVGTIRTLALLVLFLQVGRWGTTLIDTALNQGFRLAKFSETAARTAFGVVRFFAMAALWTSVAILILGNLGVEVTPLLAGLGVGGIAVGFALQRILGDIFCSVAIVLDRPFEVGDTIQTGEYLGTVESIGVKTTRVRSQGGEQIVFPNSDLIQSRIRNYQRMAERRVAFKFGVKSDTPTATVERLPGQVRAIVDGIEATRFDRAHLTALGESFLTFEVVYFVLDPDLNRSMDIQQQVNLELLRLLEGLNVRFNGG